MNIARRSVTSVTWNAVTSVFQVVVGIGRSIFLARLLPVEIFGIYGMAGSIVTLSGVLAGFGMGEAFLHRSTETKNEDHAAAVWLTLKLIFASIWLILITISAFQFTQGPDRVALVTIALTHWGIVLTAVPRQILVRRVVHRRLALLQMVNLIFSTIIALFLAWRGIELWALLSTDIVTLVLSVYFLYLWKPVWHPKLTWSASTVRYFLRFGGQNLMAQVLLKALDRVDDLWAGAYLGRDALGFYSRAYAFATYPRTILASSVNKVAGGTYAELAANRKRLSQAFFRTNAFLVRSGFFLGGLLVLSAPQLIHLLLGAKWLPMLPAFRLMLVFTLLDPIKITVANLFVAVGHPNRIVKARVVQLIVMIIGLFSLGSSQGIIGVAIAVDIMIIVGVGILFWQAREYVDFSLWKLFVAPGVSLTLGMSIAQKIVTIPRVSGSLWQIGAMKVVIFSVIYSVMLLILERHQLFKMITFFVEKVWDKGN